MKKILVILLCIMCRTNGFCQTTNFSWGNSIGSTKSELLFSSVTDLNGNIYTVGAFNSPSLVLNNISYNNQGYFDILVIKYDKSGQILWAKSFGGNFNDVPTAIQIDKSGELYIAGHFESTILQIGNDTLFNSSLLSDVFIFKMDSNGSTIWAKSFGGTSSETPNCIDVDSDCNVYLAGSFRSNSITINSQQINNSTNSQLSDAFITKFDSAGIFLWAKSFGGIQDDQINKIKIDLNNNIIVAGEFSSPKVIIGNDSITLSSLYNSDIFISKLNNLGNLIWIKSAGSQANDRIGGLCLDNYNNYYVSGLFQGFNIPFGATQLSNVYSSNFFLAKYNSNGGNVWAKNGNDSCNAGIFGLNYNIDGTINVFGGFQGSNIIFGTDTLINSGGQDIFIACYDTLGNINYAKSALGSKSESSASITSDNNGDIIICGYYSSSNVKFDSIILNNIDTTGLYDAYIVKIEKNKPNGIDNILYSNEAIHLFPNPTKNTFHMHLKSNSSIVNANIYNIQGQILKKYSCIDLESNTFNIEELKSGIYIIEVYNKNLTVRKKIKKE